ncbi:MAG: histidine kinase dimerization/phospho-acceptor domain-containing protein, partial [Verrucomicrobiota bacterium]
MPKTEPQSLRLLVGLILLPVLLLAAVAGFGLREYRHAVLAEARELAAHPAEQSGRLLERLEQILAAQPPVVLYSPSPTPNDRLSNDARDLNVERDRPDSEVLRRLTDSSERTESGLPVSVLATWRLFDRSGELPPAEKLATLAIHQAPSAITPPVLETLKARFPERGAVWQEEWKQAEAKRAVLADHAQTTGLVETDGGPAFIKGNRALTPTEIREAVPGLLIDLQLELEPWMALDVTALNQSLIGPVEEPLALGDAPLRIVIGVGDPAALYATYRRVLWWATSLMACSLLTAAVGIGMVRRTVARERRLNALKSQFVASVSHELRTPVASMRLMADALNAGTITGDAAREFHRLMSQEGARLSSLIENVLDFSRIEEGRKHYSFEATDVPSIIADAVHLMEPVAEQREVRMETRLSPLPSDPTVDPATLKQALLNLL